VKCPSCGYPGARYKVSRRRLWKGRSAKGSESSLESRKDFKAHCPRCWKEWIEDD